MKKVEENIDIMKEVEVEINITKENQGVDIIIKNIVVERVTNIVLNF